MTEQPNPISDGFVEEYRVNAQEVFDQLQASWRTVYEQASTEDASIEGLSQAVGDLYTKAIACVVAFAQLHTASRAESVALVQQDDDDKP